MKEEGDNGDELQCLTINGKIHTCVMTCFLEDAEATIAHLVEHGVDQKLRPGRAYIIRYGQADDDSLEEKRKARRGVRLGIAEIWLVGEVEEADRNL